MRGFVVSPFFRGRNNRSEENTLFAPVLLGRPARLFSSSTKPDECGPFRGDHDNSTASSQSYENPRQFDVIYACISSESPIHAGLAGTREKYRPLLVSLGRLLIPALSILPRPMETILVAFAGTCTPGYPGWLDRCRFLWFYMGQITGGDIRERSNWSVERSHDHGLLPGNAFVNSG